MVPGCNKDPQLGAGQNEAPRVPIMVWACAGCLPDERCIRLRFDCADEVYRRGKRVPANDQKQLVRCIQSMFVQSLNEMREDSVITPAVIAHIYYQPLGVVGITEPEYTFAESVEGL